MNIIDGKEIAKKIRADIKKEVKNLGFTPGLATILVGSDPASHLYVKLKQKAAEKAGIKNEVYLYFASVPEKEIIEKIKELSQRTDIHGILVQLPLPEHLDTNKIIGSIDPRKDVDGFHPDNLKKLAEGQPYILPGLALGIRKLIEATEVNLENKKALIVCNSGVFAEPIERVLAADKIIASHANPDDIQLQEKTKKADILVVAIGRPNFVGKEMIKTGAIIIDVGTNRTEEGVVGDVDFASVKDTPGFITPVPGGVGPVTVAMLLQNTLKIANNSKRKTNDALN